MPQIKNRNKDTVRQHIHNSHPVITVLTTIVTVLLVSLEEVVITVTIFLNNLSISVIVTIIMITTVTIIKGDLSVGRANRINCALIARKVHNKCRKEGKVTINLILIQW